MTLILARSAGRAATSPWRGTRPPASSIRLAERSASVQLTRRAAVTRGDAIPEQLLERARSGDAAALGRLLELYRNYLRLVARTLIGQALRVRLDASDLVQETFLKAAREFGQFLGSTEPELTAWLRQILVRTLANRAKRHRRQARDYQRQESLEAMLDRSSVAVQRALAVPSQSPSTYAVRREQAVLLADALEKL